MCLAMCLKFSKFEAGCAYELYAYKKKFVYSEKRFYIPHVLSATSKKNEGQFRGRTETK